MNRRDFLKRLTAGAAGLLVGEALERALWTPGERTHFDLHATELQALAPPTLVRIIPQDGIALRMIRSYDVTTDAFVSRIDVMYGIGILRPELAVVINA